MTSETNTSMPKPYFLSGTGSVISSIGCDPEFLYEDEHGTIIPAFSVLDEQRKNHPPSVPYIDGWQGEFGTLPTHCIAYMIDDVQRALVNATEAIKGKGKISLRSVLDVSLVDLLSDPARAQFGCTPSLNAYDAEPMMAHDGISVPFRMAGGHIHLGFHGSYKDVRTSPDHLRTVVKFLDRTAGLIGTALFSDMEDARRRLLYGRAGEYRTPSYGIEYRVPSNAWLLHPVIAHFYVGVVRRAAACAVHDLHNGINPLDRLPMNDEEVQIAINEQRPDVARALIGANMALMRELVYNVCGYSVTMTDFFIDAVMHRSLSDILPEGYTLEKAWRIGTEIGWRSHSASWNCSISTGHDDIIATKRLGIGPAKYE